MKIQFKRVESEKDCKNGIMTKRQFTSLKRRYANAKCNIWFSVAMWNNKSIGVIIHSALDNTIIPVRIVGLEKGMFNIRMEPKLKSEILDAFFYHVDIPTVTMIKMSQTLVDKLLDKGFQYFSVFHPTKDVQLVKFKIYGTRKK